MRIKVNHITQWAKERDCQGSLPLLVKKLILASSKKLTKCDFPSEDQVYLTGFDGISENKEETLFIPEGMSVWEMGCNNDWRKKANEDYLDRKKEPLEIKQENTTYIQVSPQLIERKEIEDWTKRRIRQNIWKDVKLYGALELETWINETPSVERWFAEKLGFPNKGVETLERWWDKWCQLDETLKISSELVLTDKENEVAKLANELKNNKKITVKSSNADETIAFLYAAITTLPEKDLYLSKALVIHDEDSMEFYSQMDNLILIPTFDNYVYYTDKDNIIYIPSFSKNPTIELTDPMKLHFIENLEKLGIDYTTAKRYARDSGRNLTILKRLFKPEIKPNWIKEDNINLLLTLFFTGYVNDENIHDQKIVEELSGMSYEEFLHKLLILSNEDESPIFKNNNKCFLKSQKDMLFRIGSYISIFDLVKVEKIIFKIFKSYPIYKRGKYLKCSGKLKEGILKSLILISVFGEDVNMNYISPENWVDNIIYQIFKNESEEFWDNNSYYLKLMAEASPQIYLRTINETLKQNKNYLMKHLHYVLSSLKILALNPFIFQEIIDMHLILLNYEFNEEIIKYLKELFIPWYINTCTSLKHRLKILDYILEKNPKADWEILKYLLSTESDFLAINNEPQWRVFCEKFTITNKDLLEFYHEVRLKLLNYLEFDMEKWSFALDHYRECEYGEFHVILIEKLYEYIEIEPENIELWNILRKNIILLNAFPEHSDLTKIPPLKDLYYKITPKKLILRYTYLFDDNWVEVLDATFDQMQNELAHKRKDAINYIYKIRGFEGIKELINSVECPSIIGYYMSDKNIDELVLGVINENNKMNSFASRYISRKSEIYKNWSYKIITLIMNEKFDENKVILILTSLDVNCEVWRKIKLFKPHIQEEYWRKLNYSNYCKNSKECKYYFNKHLKYFSPNELIEFISRNITKLDFDNIVEILLKIEIDDEFLYSNQFLGKNILKILNDNNYDDEKLIKLEFKLSSSFKFEKIPYPLKIHEKMSKNPEIVSYLIKRRKNEDFKFKNKCINIFNTWSIIPGTKSDGEIDYEILQKWYAKCLKNLDENEIIEFDYLIGHLLSKSSNENNEIWPKKDICRFIDENNDEKINDSFYNGITTKYSTYSKSVYDGGRREMNIANQYMKYAENILDEYPITAKILYDVSKKYEKDAKHEKFEADNIDYEYN